MAEQLSAKLLLLDGRQFAQELISLSQQGGQSPAEMMVPVFVGAMMQIDSADLFPQFRFADPVECLISPQGLVIGKTGCLAINGQTASKAALTLPEGPGRIDGFTELMVEICHVVEGFYSKSAPPSISLSAAPRRKSQPSNSSPRT